jgi:PAS domain S-box-containing protein
VTLEDLTRKDQALAFLSGGGETGALMRARDWSSSPLGPAAAWPQALKTLVGVMLGSIQPMFVAWGPRRIMLYNDGYAELCWERHPDALGAPFAEVWHDIMDDVSPILDRAFAGEATQMDDIMFVMERDGRPQEAHFAFSYTPVRDEAGAVAGMFCACNETTQVRLAERRWTEDFQRQMRLFEQAPGFIAILRGPDHVFEFVNESYVRLVNRRDLIGRSVLEALPEVEEQGFLDLLDRVYSTGERYIAQHVPVLLRRAPGDALEEVFVDFIYEPIPDESGRITGIFCEGHDVTARKRAEDEQRAIEARLRESEEFNRRVLASSRDCIKVLTLDGRLESMSEGGQRGLAIDDIRPFIGASWIELFRSDAQSRARMAVAKAAKGETAQFEANLPTMTGEPRYWDTVLTPILGADGRPERLLALSRDITQRKAAEAALRESEARFREQFENANDYIFTADLGMRITGCNPAVARALGHEPSELVGRSIADFVPPDIWERTKAMLAAKLSGEQDTTRYPVEVFGPDGGRMVWEINSRLIRDAEGNPTGLHAIGRNVTDAVRAQAALRREEQRYRDLANAVPAFIWFATASGEIEYLNERWYDYTGQTPEQALPDGWALTLHPDDKEPTAAAWAGAREREVPYEVECRYRRRDGEYRWYVARAEPLRDEAGAVAGWFGTSVDIHDRKHAEQALRESEERYRQIVEGAEDFAIITLDDGGTITSWNSGAERMTGFAANKACGRGGEFFFTPEDRAAGAPDHELNRAQADGRAVNERWHMREDGSRFWGSGLLMRLDTPGGGYLKIFRDRTAEHQAEAELRESEARLRALTDHLPGGMVYQIATSKDGGDRRFIYVSQSNHRLTGVPAETLLADPMAAYNLIHPDDRELMAAAEAEAIRTRSAFDVEVRFRRSDAALRWCRIISAPREQPDGSLVWDGIQIDITEQKQVEEALSVASAAAEAEAAERSAILGQLAEGVIVTDAEGRITFVNEAARRLHGVAALDVAPSDYSGTYHLFREDGSPYPSEELPLARAVLHGEAVVDARWRIRRPDGSEVLAIGSAQPLRGPGGAPLGAVLTLSDDTARHAAEQALRALNDTLEQRVEERTEELVQAQEQLRQSQKLEAMGQLTGGVAHDFNNLLTPIIGGLDMLKRRGIGGEREQRLIDGGLQSAERAKTLVQRLLAFARRQPLQPGAVDVAGLVAGMADLIASTSGPQIKLTVEVPETLPPARADRNQLEMAILNLSVNARDAMPNGGALTISAAPEAVKAGHRSKLRPGEYVRLSVADTGIGMDEATLARAVEPFFSTKGIGKGTGLGLSMVHGLAAQLGGGFAISSRPGLGTCVDLWLPLSDEAAGEVAEAGAKPPARRGMGTALLVDDEELVRMSTADMLAEFGYEVVEAASAAEALAKLDGGLVFDLLVTDHMMPGMNGADLAREVRDRVPGKPVLIVSGYAETEGIAPDLPRLTKPFRQADLAACLVSMAAADAGSA